MCVNACHLAARRRRLCQRANKDPESAASAGAVPPARGFGSFSGASLAVELCGSALLALHAWAAAAPSASSGAPAALLRVAAVTRAAQLPLLRVAGRLQVSTASRPSPIV